MGVEDTNYSHKEVTNVSRAIADKLIGAVEEDQATREEVVAGQEVEEETNEIEVDEEVVEEVVEDQADDAEYVELEVVEIDGEEIELDDVINTYKFKKANTQRAQQLADEKKAFEAEKQALQKQLSDMNAMKAQLENQLGTGTSNIDQQIKELIKEQIKADAEEDDDLVDEIDRKISRLQRKKMLEEEANKERLEEFNKVQSEQYAQIVYAEQEAFIKAVPNAKDNAQEVVQAVIDGAKKFGFTEDEINNVVDHRVWHAFYQLGKLDEKPTTEKLKGKKKVKTVKKVVKSGGSQPAKKANADDEQVKQLKAKAAKGDKKAMSDLFKHRVQQI